MPSDLLILIIPIFQFPICATQIDEACIGKIAFEFHECRPPCEGIYADVKKSKVEILDEAHFQLLNHSYEKWFLQGHENIPFNSEGECNENANIKLI